MAKFSFRSHPLLTAVGVVAVGALILWRLEPILMHVAAKAIVESEKPAQGVEISRHMQAPDFALRDSDGKLVHLSDFRGKVVLLNFWATWCGPCKYEIPWFIEFQNRYKGDGFTIVGVSMDDNGWAAIRPYMAAARMNYPVLLGNEKVSQAYGGIEALPTSLVLDRDGKIQYLHAGLAGKDEYREEILSLLRGKNQDTVAGRISGSPARTN
ncbi:MAG TPA: TlpA disulfide reductase family protein [Bryobacteraceae bacterium]|nr:TlpA disulfide reductase family protein [Bryobacteraceae bacterium]